MITLRPDYCDGVLDAVRLFRTVKPEHLAEVFDAIEETIVGINSCEPRRRDNRFAEEAGIMSAYGHRVNAPSSPDPIWIAVAQEPGK